MRDALDIAVLVGSLRKDSINKKVAAQLAALAPRALSLDVLDIGHLELYNQDYDLASPPSYTAFRRRIAAADGIIFVTPEHNRSMPAAMKNALDIGSRPFGQSVWDKKPGAVISASPSLQGGFGANHHLRQSLCCLNVYCMANPEVYLSQADRLFSEAGDLSEQGRLRLSAFIDSYVRWIGQFAADQAVPRQGGDSASA